MALSEPITPSDLSEGTISEATYMCLGDFAFFEVSIYNGDGRPIFGGYKEPQAPVYIDPPPSDKLKSIKLDRGDLPPYISLFPFGKPVVNNPGSSFTGYGFTGLAGHDRLSSNVMVVPIIAAYGMHLGWELFNARTGRRLLVREVGAYLTFSGVASIKYINWKYREGQA